MIAIASAIPLRRVPTDVTQLLRLIVDLMAPQAKAHDVTLTVAVDEDLQTPIAIDAQKIAWAVGALVGNALRYVRHGTARMPGGAISVRARLDADAHEIIVEVQDDGRGIPDALVRRLAEGPPSENPYSALALTMIRDVVVAHGGRLDIDSRTDAIGHGTTVRFTLPVV